MNHQPMPLSGRAGGNDFEGQFAGRRNTLQSSPAARHVQTLADAILWHIVALLARFGIFSSVLSRALDRAVLRQEARHG